MHERLPLLYLDGEHEFERLGAAHVLELEMFLVRRVLIRVARLVRLHRLAFEARLDDPRDDGIASSFAAFCRICFAMRTSTLVVSLAILFAANGCGSSSGGSTGTAGAKGSAGSSGTAGAGTAGSTGTAGGGTAGADGGGSAGADGGGSAGAGTAGAGDAGTAGATGDGRHGWGGRQRGDLRQRARRRPSAPTATPSTRRGLV